MSLGKLRDHTRPAYLLLLPTLIPMVLFVVLPIGAAIYLAFTNFQPYTGTADFVGLSNFAELLDDRLFFITVRNTVFFTVLYVPATMALGFVTALLLERSFRGVGLLRLAYYLPTLTTGVVVAYFAALLIQPNSGWINIALRGVGLPQVMWMREADHAIFVLVGAAVWGSFGWAMLIYLAGLTAIPDDLYDAAKIDGAGRAQRIWYITIPLLRPITLTVVVLLSIFSLQVFDIVNVLADKWLPLESVTTMVHQIYLTAFRFNDAGYAAAMAVVLFAMIAAISYINYRMISKDAM